MFIAGFALLSLITTENISQQAAMLLKIALVIFAVGGSFLIYNVLVKFVIKKFDLEDKMGPLFSRKPKK